MTTTTLRRTDVSGSGRHLGHLFRARRERGEPRTVELAAGAVWSAPGERGGATIVCLAGTLWVTVEGDGHDHVLRAGESFTTTLPGRIAAYALAPARFTSWSRAE